jgi:hypothetical protein
MYYGWMREILHYANKLEPQHWLLVLLAAIVIGFVCMRGFGSRSQY